MGNDFQDSLSGTPVYKENYRLFYASNSSFYVWLFLFLVTRGRHVWLGFVITHCFVWYVVIFSHLNNENMDRLSNHVIWKNCILSGSSIFQRKFENKALTLNNSYTFYTRLKFSKLILESIHNMGNYVLFTLFSCCSITSSLFSLKNFYKNRGNTIGEIKIKTN